MLTNLRVDFDVGSTPEESRSLSLRLKTLRHVKFALFPNMPFDLTQELSRVELQVSVINDV